MTLPPPHPALRASVAVPARDEAAQVGACLAALADQRDVPPEAYEVLLVLDACADDTEARARDVAATHPDLRLHLLEGPGRGSGPARALAMDAACTRLLAVGRPDGLVASTDADSRVAPDWLVAQLAAVAAGARAIGGRIKLHPHAVATLPARVLRRQAERGARRHAQVITETGGDPAQSGHWQYSGASLALTAATYREVGGLDRTYDLEDERLERRLQERGVPIVRSLAVRVTTSAKMRTDGVRGLAQDLARDHRPEDEPAPA